MTRQHSCRDVQKLQWSLWWPAWWSIFFPLDLWKLRIKMDQWNGFLCVVASLVLQRMPWKTETRVTHSVLIYWGRDKMAAVLLTIFSLFSLFFLHENLYFDSNFSEVCSLGSDTCASHVWRLTEAIHVNQWCLSLLTRASFSLSGYTTWWRHQMETFSA